MIATVTLSDGRRVNLAHVTETDTNHERGRIFQALIAEREQLRLEVTLEDLAFVNAALDTFNVNGVRDRLRAEMVAQIACSEMRRTDNQFNNGYVRFDPGLPKFHAGDAEYCVHVADCLLTALDTFAVKTGGGA